MSKVPVFGRLKLHFEENLGRNKNVFFAQEKISDFFLEGKSENSENFFEGEKKGGMRNPNEF